MEMNMRLIGAPTLADVNPTMVDVSAITARNVGSTADNLFAQNYEGLRTREFAKPQPKGKL